MISIERTRGGGGEGAKGSRLLRVRGPLSTQSDDYTRGSRVTRHLVLPLSTCNVVAHTHTHTNIEKVEKKILLTSDTVANFHGSLDARKEGRIFHREMEIILLFKKMFAIATNEMYNCAYNFRDSNSEKVVQVYYKGRKFSLTNNYLFIVYDITTASKKYFHQYF